jgi:subtilisin family serine protease
LQARSRLPQHPLPGERGFTGVPPPGETRFVSNEMVFHVAPNISRQAVENVARKLNLTMVGSHNVALTGGTMFHFRVANGRSVADAVRGLEAEKLGVAQPNYVFKLQQDPKLAARTQGGELGQYVVNKLHLGEVHRVATGSNVLVAVIDSEIDSRHPDLAGAFVERYDAVGRPDKPHVHGTGMAGAIAAHRQLMGIAPGAKILAIHAFSPDAGESPQATTQHILAGLEWAISRGARVINMSFAGPYDPMLQLAMKSAHDKGVVLIAAAGNLGPKSPPLYPAADPNVIAVTAVDQNDHLFADANQGPYIAVAAPGVNVLEPAPDSGYQITTGTSVAAAHVTGVAALMLERNRSLDPDTVHEILTSSAKPLAPGRRNDQYGWGLVDPAKALFDIDTQRANDRQKNPAKAAAPKPGTLSSR